MALSPIGVLLRQVSQLASSELGRTVPDAQLLERYLHDRDEAAFELLVWRHGGLVWNVCRRLLRDNQEAEDAFQATFLTFVRKARSISKREAIGSWLYKVAYRIALRLRAKSDRKTLS